MVLWLLINKKEINSLEEKIKKQENLKRKEIKNIFLSKLDKTLSSKQFKEIALNHAGEGKYKDAILNFKKAVAIEKTKKPLDIDNLFRYTKYLGLAYYREKEYELAGINFKKSIGYFKKDGVLRSHRRDHHKPSGRGRRNRTRGHDE